jgi:hypothetical protein
MTMRPRWSELYVACSMSRNWVLTKPLTDKEREDARALKGHPHV